MNKWIKKIVAVSFIFAQFLIIPNVSASSLEEIQNKKTTIQQEVSQLQQEVSQQLEEVSAITIELEELNTEIAEHEVTIVETEEDITEQEVLVAQRIEYTANQLQSLQKSEVNNNILLSLLQADSISEVINMIYSASVLTSASEERLAETQVEHDKLKDMRESLLAEKESLDNKQTAVVEKKDALDSKVAELRNVLAANETELSNLNAEERAVKERQAAERKAAAEAEAAAVASSNSTPSSNVTTATSNAKSNTQTAPAKSNSNNTQAASTSSAGAWKTVQATGYSTQQKGLSTHTAMGIDLRVNPRVIAVDPRVIPLGSLVEVQGLGVYVAGDTGGAIKGNIIDIHYSTVGQALNWGRRNVKIRVIN